MKVFRVTKGIIFFVCSTDSVLFVGQMNESKEAIKRCEGQV